MGFKQYMKFSENDLYDIQMFKRKGFTVYKEINKQHTKYRHKIFAITVSMHVKILVLLQ